MSELRPVSEPPSMFDSIKKTIEALRESDLGPIEFAIEAIRLNLVMAAYKDETILYEALEKLREFRLVEKGKRLAKTVEDGEWEARDPTPEEQERIDAIKAKDDRCRSEAGREGQ